MHQPGPREADYINLLGHHPSAAGHALPAKTEIYLLLGYSCHHSGVCCPCSGSPSRSPQAYIASTAVCCSHSFLGVLGEWGRLRSPKVSTGGLLFIQMGTRHPGGRVWPQCRLRISWQPLQGITLYLVSWPRHLACPMFPRVHIP